MSFNWYIPTFHGDIKLQANDGKTILRAFELTPSEKQALTTLRKRAIRNNWASNEEFPPLSAPTYRSDGVTTIMLQAPLRKVQQVLTTALKPDRKLLDVILFRSGKVEEAGGFKIEIIGQQNKPEETADDEQLPAPAPAKKPVAAATVAQPVQGCPAPNFQQAEQRATRVLGVFLTPEQIEDFNRHGRFVTQGAMTGHRYMLTSRTRCDQLCNFSHRTVYDLDEHRPYCVHDWSVPPAEELLALHLFLRTPGYEEYLRALPE